jgi:hypothetical protein
VLNLFIAANATMKRLIFGKTTPIVKVVPRRHKTPPITIDSKVYDENPSKLRVNLA